MVDFNFRNLVFTMQEWGINDVMLPFILIFAIFFAVLQKTKILGKTKEDKPKKNFNVIISLTMALSFIMPHVLGKYPPSGDPVVIIGKAIPQVILIILVGLCFFIIAGLFGIKPENYLEMTYSWITLILLNIFIINAYPSLADFMLILSAFMIIMSLLIGGEGYAGKIPVILFFLIFMVFHWAMTGWNQATPSWLAWLENSDTQSLIIMLLTFLTIVAFIMKKDN